VAEPVRGATAVLLLSALVLSGLLSACGSTVPGTPQPLRITDVERELVAGYFEDLNEAGEQGAAQQKELLRETQHPDFRGGDCRLPSGTLRVVPTMSTLRLDPAWTPPGEDEHPRGVVLAVAVTVTLLQDGMEVATQIGSQHVVLLSGKAYGFAPCAA
jgi:hypothetical protein